LQCVERGLIGLDEPVYRHLPELENFGIISKSTDPTSELPFTLRPRTKDVTVRNLLLHSSGIGYYEKKLLQQWRVAAGDEKEENRLIYETAMPLVFEPGEGWVYGGSIRAAQLLLERLTKMNIEEYTQENVFRPLNMTSTTYAPAGREDIVLRSLKKVQRAEDGKLYPDNQRMYGLTSCASDFHTLLVDLMSGKSKILKETESLNLFFEPQFEPGSSSLAALRADPECYEYPAGIPRGMKDPPVNYSAGGLVAEERLELSHIPAGTVTWNAFPNVVWTLNRRKGLGMVFATQLAPVDDEKTVDLMMTFFREAWRNFN
jgi:CubicO group peptidase (beta-lactamase class C family)